MVLTQRTAEVLLDEFPEEFPYHYGSYATCSCAKAITKINGGFHTTMVLTQQKAVR